MPQSKEDNILNTDPEAWTPEKLAEVKAKLTPIVQRFRKVRGELAVADTKTAVEKAAKKTKRATKKPSENKNLDLEKPL